jgi:hypothetical protein
MPNPVSTPQDLALRGTAVQKAGERAVKRETIRFDRHNLQHLAALRLHFPGLWRSLVEKNRKPALARLLAAPTCYRQSELTPVDLVHGPGRYLEVKFFLPQDLALHVAADQIADANRRLPAGYAYCPRCDIVGATIDDGETCARCKLVLPGVRVDA